jgi:TP901 family phage tail tape measure protein
MPKIPAKKFKKDGTATKAYNEYLKQMKGMTAANKKFNDRAAKAGIKSMGKAGDPKTAAKFAKQDATERQRQINLMKQLHHENVQLIKTKGKGAASAKRENAAMEKQMKELILLDKDAIQLEKKEANIKRKNFQQYKKNASKLHRQNKQEINDMKLKSQAYRKLGDQAKRYASGLAGGLKNAFVIGTAAAAAFAYKLQPVIEQVTKFERTIINANSVFGVSREELHSVTDEMVRFGLQYGVSTQDAATGLYQLASAGLSAADSQEVLRSTLLLAMATQGDHNTLAKLTVQTIMGFGMEMTQAAELTDKFAHTIQKSLVEWQDLASSVKFAMPFFVATGQSIDQLLGGIEVLSNRALEAGIAGRGLRQALAQIAKHAHDNDDALKKMGLQTMNADGSMRNLTEIAMDASKIFKDMGYSDVESLTAMLESMNVRGATAFALLAQNADEFTAAVTNLQNAAGEATAMADLQQESLEAQIQRVKTALIAPFLFSDKVGEASGTLNTFTLQIKELVDEFVGFFIQGEAGQEKLTEFSYQIQEFVIVVFADLLDVVRELKKIFLEQEAGLDTFQKMLTLATKPLMIMLKVLDKIGPNMLNWIIYMKMASKLLPISTILTMAQTKAQLALALATQKQNLLTKKGAAADVEKITTLTLLGFSTEATTMSVLKGAAAWTLYGAAALGAFYGFYKIYEWLNGFLSTLGLLTVALIAGAAAWYMYTTAMSGPFALATGMSITTSWAIGMAVVAAAAAAILSGAILGQLGGPFTKSPNDTGGSFMPAYYDTGGVSEDHQLAVVQRGETIVPKTQNMLNGGGSGITINISGDVYDGDNFADKLAEVLPQALNSASDTASLAIRTSTLGTSFGQTAINRGSSITEGGN